MTNVSCPRRTLFLGMMVGVALVWLPLWEGGCLAAQDGDSDRRPVVEADSQMNTCPTDLSSLQPQVESALRYVRFSSFRNTLLSSLQVSIPEAIEQADGLSEQITFLQQEIMRQDQERAHAEAAAREITKDPGQPLTPCRRQVESNYCYAMDQYYVATAANLVNRAFLSALECYQGQGMR
jgi:hypothetical protein